MSETATKGETGREEEEEGRDVVPTAQLSLAQVDICPRSFPLHSCAHIAPGALREADGWTYGGGEWMLGGRLNEGRQDRQREREEGRMKGGLLGH